MNHDSISRSQQTNYLRSIFKYLKHVFKFFFHVKEKHSCTDNGIATEIIEIKLGKPQEYQKLGKPHELMAQVKFYLVINENVSH